VLANMVDEEMAFKMVELYLKDVSQRGDKRQMGLDTIINAYFYALGRLKNKDKELGLIEEVVEKEEGDLSDDLEQIKFEKSKEDSTGAFDFLSGED